MACFYPLKAYVGREEKVTFNYKDAFRTPSGKIFEVKLPCGRCIGCKLQRSKSWAMRCVHEASLYENNCFITLTFSEDFPSKTYTLHKSDFQKFMKRLRRRFPGRKIRYYHAGEYGEKLQRPHHHACLFNFDFPDKYLWSTSGGNKLYRSNILEKLWSDPKSGLSYGFSAIGDVTFESAAYVARYVTKKITGDQAKAYYRGREPEYTTMSRRPGIGKAWIDKYPSDVYPHDFVHVRGNHKCKPPRYYDDKYDLQCKEKSGKIGLSMEDIKKRREVIARNDSNNSDKRLKAREKYTKALFKRKERKYETEGVQSI